MKNQIVNLLLSALICTSSPLFAMEPLKDSEAERTIAVFPKDISLFEDKPEGLISTLCRDNLRHIFFYVFSIDAAIDFIHYRTVSRTWQKTIGPALHSVVVTGPPMCGVTTLVHLLAGKELNAKEVLADPRSFSPHKYELTCEHPLEGITISSIVWSRKTKKLGGTLDLRNHRVICDFPNVYPNLDRDIDNAKKIHPLLKGEIRFIFVIAENVFHHPSTFLHDYICNLPKIFPDLEKFQNSSTLVISQTSGRTPSSDLLKRLALDTFPSAMLSEEEVRQIRSFGQHFIDNPSKVIEFPAPQKDGAYVINESLSSFINTIGVSSKAVDH